MDNNVTFPENVFTHRGPKLLLFVVSYILAVATVLIISNPHELDRLDIRIFFIALVFFPTGFGWPIFITSDPGTSTIIGWIIYVIMTVSAIATTNSRIAKILYFIFVFLLILNIIGCTIK